MIPPRPGAPIVLALGLLCSLAACSKGPEQRSVILITIDTLRADHLSGAGYGRRTSPHLDRLAQEGTSFDWALSPTSYTRPSHASMLTGLDPSFHSVGLLNYELALRPEERTLPEICGAAGLSTAAVVSNFILQKGSGLEQGFATYDDRLPDLEQVRRLPERSAKHAVDSALALLPSLEQGRFFLWLHLQDPHGPYTPAAHIAEPEPVGAAPERLERALPLGTDQSGYRSIPAYQGVGTERAFEQYRARYDREIKATDQELGRFLDALRAKGLLDTTLVIVTADHGEALGEDDYFFSHCHSVGLDQVHVPLIVAGPGVREGARIAAPVGNLDVFATALEFLDLPAPAGTHSRSLVPVLRGAAPVPEGPVFTASISQRGIALGGQYLRTDRFPATDTEFWRVNPLNQSTFVPLGTNAWSLAGRQAVPIEPLPELLTRLQQFGAEADAALKALTSGLDTRAIDEGARRSLRALGYAK